MNRTVLFLRLSHIFVKCNNLYGASKLGSLNTDINFARSVMATCNKCTFATNS